MVVFIIFVSERDEKVGEFKSRWKIGSSVCDDDDDDDESWIFSNLI